jgi:hypothetical protein
LIHIIVIVAEAGLDRHYPATSSIRVGSSSPVPVLLTRLDTGHMAVDSLGCPRLEVAKLPSTVDAWLAALAKKSGSRESSAAASHRRAS